MYVNFKGSKYDSLLQERLLCQETMISGYDSQNNEGICIVRGKKCGEKGQKTGKMCENSSQNVYLAYLSKIYFVETKWVNCACGVL